MPRRVKHRKVGRAAWMSGMAKGGHTVPIGDHGLATLQAGLNRRLRQSEAGSTRHEPPVKRGGKILLTCVFPNKPATKKPAETRHGLGQGRTSSTTGSRRQALAGSCSRWRAWETTRRPSRAMRLSGLKLPVAKGGVVTRDNCPGAGSDGHIGEAR